MTPHDLIRLLHDALMREQPFSADLATACRDGAAAQAWDACEDPVAMLEILARLDPEPAIAACVSVVHRGLRDAGVADADLLAEHAAGVVPAPADLEGRLGPLFDAVVALREHARREGAWRDLAAVAVAGMVARLLVEQGCPHHYCCNRADELGHDCGWPLRVAAWVRHAVGRPALAGL